MPNPINLDIEIVENLYSTGFSYREIADHFGCSISVVQRHVKQSDICPRPSYNSTGKPCSESSKRKISLSLKGKPKSKEHKLNLSKAKSGQRNPNYGQKCSHGKRCWVKCPDGTIVSMRSTWEAAYAQWLDENNIRWQYEPQTFILPNGAAYTPDFLVENDYVEVKGWLRQEHLEKFDLFRSAFNKKLIVADKSYLMSLGIDLSWDRLLQFTNKLPPILSCDSCGRRFIRKHKTQKMCSVRCRNRYIASNRNT